MNTQPRPIAPTLCAVEKVPRPHRRLQILLRLLTAVILAAIATLVLFVYVVTPGFSPQVASIPARVRSSLIKNHGQYTPASAIALVMQHAIVAIEDHRFYQDHGVDMIAMARAAVNDVRMGRFAQGGSTITEQLQERVFFHDAASPAQELETLPLAWETQQRFSKAQILALYLNACYFGRHAYGIGEAAHVYFHKLPSQLDVAQSAFLASLVQAPSYYGSHPHSPAAVSRWRTDIHNLGQFGYITEAQSQSALRQGIHLE